MNIRENVTFFFKCSQYDRTSPTCNLNYKKITSKLKMFKDLMFFIFSQYLLYVATLTFGCLLMLQSLSENSFSHFFQ